MDRIAFAIVKSSHGTVHEGEDVVDIFVNGRNIIDIIKAVELPFAEREGHPDTAGGYEGLPADIVFLPSRHLLDQPDEAYEYGGRISILECDSCGYPGCWPFIVRVTVDADRVTWSDFENYHRGREGPAQHAEERQWKYDLLKPLVFDRKQYESELTRRQD